MFDKRKKKKKRDDYYDLIGQVVRDNFQNVQVVLGYENVENRCDLEGRRRRHADSSESVRPGLIWSSNEIE